MLRTAFKKTGTPGCAPGTRRWIATCRQARATSTGFTVPRRPAWSRDAPDAPPILKDVLNKSRGLMVATALLVGGCVWAPAAGAVTVNATLQASFTPNVLGASTTIGFGFHLATAEGLAPPPLANIDLHMPAGMNYTATTLGLAICQPEELEKHGLNGCPANSRLGSGSAFVEVPFGTGSGQEIPEIQALMGPPSPPATSSCCSTPTARPRSSRSWSSGAKCCPRRGASARSWPPTCRRSPACPTAPTSRSSACSPRSARADLTYYKHVHGRRVAFHPVGIARAGTLPTRRLPVHRHVRLPGRLDRRSGDDGSVPAARAAPAPQVASGRGRATSPGWPARRPGDRPCSSDRRGVSPAGRPRGARRWRGSRASRRSPPRRR